MRVGSWHSLQSDSREVYGTGHLVCRLLLDTQERRTVGSSGVERICRLRIAREALSGLDVRLLRAGNFASRSREWIAYRFNAKFENGRGRMRSGYFPLIRLTNNCKNRSASDAKHTRAFGFNGTTPSIS